jgi:hypothetical protein
MKLVFVFMTLGEARLVAGVDDGAGKFRRITATWQAVENAHLPPKTWADTVRGEADLRRTEDANPNPVRKFL